MRYKDPSLRQTSVLTQLWGMLKRQVTIKIRDRRRTFSEIVLPLYSLSLLIILKLAVPNPNYLAQDSAPQTLTFVKDLETLFEKKNSSSIAIVPHTAQTQNFTEQMTAFYNSARKSTANRSSYSSSLNSPSFLFFNSSEDLLLAYYKQAGSIAYAIVFSELHESLSYQIRSNPSVHRTPPTSDLFSPPSACRHHESQFSEAWQSHLRHSQSNKTEVGGPAFFKSEADECPAQEYVTEGFFALQAWVDGTYMSSQHKKNYQLPKIQLQMFPKGAFTGDWLLGLRLVIPIYIVMSLSQFLTYLIITVVGEKENSLKEGMRIMGLRDPAYWFSYFFMYVVIVTFHSSLTAFLLWYLKVFQHTNMAILYLLLISYSFSLIMFAFFLTPFFDKASSAGIVASFAVNIISLLYFLQVFLAKSPTIVFWFISLMSSAGFALAMDKALIMDLSGEGVQWSNLWSNPSNIGLPFGHSLVIMIVDIILYGTLAYYLDNVLPSKYGNSKSPFFFLKASFWSEKRIRRCRIAENYVQYNANVNSMFSGDEELDLTLRVVDEETNEEIDETLTNQGEIHRAVPDIQPHFGIAGFMSDPMTEMCKSTPDILESTPESKTGFLPNYGIIRKKGAINLNNTFPMDKNDVSNHIQQKEDIAFKVESKYVDETEATHMEIEFAPRNGNPFRNNPKTTPNGTREPICREDDIEAVSADLIGREAIVIENLSKEFSACRKPKTTALENINLTMYEGHITAILGHNGAGKTTLFNILTGLTLPTNGTAYVYGYDVRDPDGMAMIRRMIGVCPQSDLLFHLLTPQEHLQFYAHLKGIQKRRRRKEITRTLQDVDLSDKASVLVKYLSGGQKRKLSVAIAILGNPKIIILDEPTAGIDPYSRRHMWSILQKMRSDRVILLTTHFMDEADILADRKAVISKGRIRCCGSSLFLKNKFGVGYHLTLVLDTDFDEESIALLIYRHIPNAEKTRRHGKELAYILPYNAVDKFAGLFAAIEEEIKREEFNIGITTYGVSMTSLEEVFLQLEKDESETDGKSSSMQNTAKNIAKNKRKNRKRKIKYAALENETAIKGEDGKAVNPKIDKTDKTVTGIGHEPISTRRSAWQVFGTITKLRLIRLKRDVQKLYIMLIFPLLFAAIGMYMHGNSNIQFVNKALNLSQYSYKDSYRIAVNVDNSSNAGKLFEFFDNSSTIPYNGSYLSLLSYNQTTPLLGAINIHSLDNFTLLYNDTCKHSLPILLNVLDNVLDRYYKHSVEKVLKSIHIQKVNSTPVFSPRFRKRPRVVDSLSYSSVRAEVDPLPMTSLSPNFNTGLFSMSLFLGMVFVLIPVNMSVELVMDRENKSKNQLRVNGLGAVIYFLSHFLILILLILTVYIGLLVLIYVFNLSFLKNKLSFLVMGLLISASTPSLILFCTCLSYLFKRTASARSIMPNIVTVFAFIPFVIVSCCHMYHIGNDLYHRLHTFFCLVDTIYIPYSIIYFMDIVHIDCELRNNCERLTFMDYLTAPDLQTILVCSLAQIPFLFAVLLYLDAKVGGTRHTDIWRVLFGRSRAVSADEYEEEGEEGREWDEDVERERVKVKDIVECNVVYNQPVVLLQNLTKVYNKGLDRKKTRDIRKKEKVAVKNLNLCIDQGEVFGLLGHNGAGKTTTLKIITFEEMPTSGMVQIGGHNVTTNFGSAFQLLGYCPQHNALWYNVTLREHLETYAAIRGVPKFDIPRLVNSFISGLHIEEHADKQVMACSGGTKRKLSFALAMIGNPRIVLLDEPSTGMDPKSKRFLWDTILASFQGSRGAVLTTHSMEEADALCSRVGIMVKGQLRCVGSTQHLKNRYGAGYTLEIKMKVNPVQPFHHLRGHYPSHISTIQNSTLLDHSQQSHKADQIKSLIQRLFNSQAAIVEEFVDRLVFSVPQGAVTSLADTFVALEKAKKDFSIEEYSFSQTTLEQVYLKFAQMNGEKVEDD